MLQKEEQAHDELIERFDYEEHWVSQAETLSLSFAITGLVLLALLINVFMV